MSAFDALAESYDQRFSASPLGRLLRRAVWDRLDPLLTPGQLWLDLGCGTGEDALHLARHGCRVLGLDASAAMIQQARRKAAAAGLSPEQARFCIADLDRLDALPELGQTGADGGLANFGVLNGVADPARLARQLGVFLAPGAPFLALTMGPVCAWEIVSSLLTARPGRAFRRLRPAPCFQTKTGELRLTYPSHGALARALAPEFRPVSAPEALGLILPPSDAGAWLRRRPRLLAAVGRLERPMARWPGAARLADHHLMHFQRSP